MKKLSFLLPVLALFLLACQNEVVKDYATISGKITNHLGKNGSLRAEGYQKEIHINEDGTFSDTVHVGVKGKVFTFSDGNEVTDVFLKNGYDLHLTLNTDEFDESLKYTGKGAENNNFLAQKMLLLLLIYLTKTKLILMRSWIKSLPKKWLSWKKPRTWIRSWSPLKKQVSKTLNLK